MKTKAYILIVEDKALLYKQMSLLLKNNHYSTSDYTPSFEKAIKAIHLKKPDLALLDIQLKGEKTGIELGKKLTEEFGIPFIYITDFGDDETFYKSLATQHKQFLVKTKPHLDDKVLLRAIQTVLNNVNRKQKQPSKKALLCYTGYINQLKRLAKDQISQVPVPYQEITKITTKTENGDKLKPNYVRIETYQKKSYYLPISLTEIAGQMPLQLARINESEIVNIGEEILDGRINGSRLKIGDTTHHISKTYKPEIENRLSLLYQKPK